MKMSMTVKQKYEEALRLPDEGKVILAEQLIEYVESHIDKNLERIHLDTAKRRRDEMRSGNVISLDGEEALARVRQTVKL